MQPQDQNNTQPPVTPSGSPQMPVTPTEPPKNNKNALIILVAVVILAVLGILVFAMMNANKNTNSNTQPNNTNNSSNNGNTTPSSDKFQTFNVTDKLTGASYSVSFFKDAKVEEKNGRTYLNSGPAGSMYSVYLGVAESKIDCDTLASTTMRLGGESTTVCYKSDNTQYGGNAKTKDGQVKVILAGQKPISMDDAKAILESITFN